MSLNSGTTAAFSTRNNIKINRKSSRKHQRFRKLRLEVRGERTRNKRQTIYDYSSD